MSSIEQMNVSRLGAHILCWLACHEKGGTAREIAVALFKDAGREAEQLRLVESELAAFQKAGLIKPVRKASFIATRRGESTALGVLGLGKLDPKANWRVVKDQLEKRLLEETRPPTPPAPPSPDSTASTPDEEKAASTLARMFPLDLGPTPALSQVISALAWHALGVKTNEPFTAQAAIRVLLNRLAGTRTLLPIDQVIEQLITKGPALETSTPKAINGAAQPPAQPAIVPLPEDDAAFAARVLAAARASKTGRFGGDKVFISHILRRLAEEGAAVGDTEGLKARLVSVHRQGLLSLSRADLVEAMDPKDVANSETRYLSATFHFVRI